MTRTRTRGSRAAKAAGRHAADATPMFIDVDQRPLHRCVAAALDGYFEQLDGDGAQGLYDLLIAEVERPLLESVMRHVEDNQSRAAEVLGVNRGTLRRKLKQHGLLDT